MKVLHKYINNVKNHHLTPYYIWSECFFLLILQRSFREACPVGLTYDSRD